VFIVTLINVFKRSKRSVFDSLKDLTKINEIKPVTKSYTKCEYCGTELDNGIKKCPSCGAKVSK